MKMYLLRFQEHEKNIPLSFFLNKNMAKETLICILGYSGELQTNKHSNKCRVLSKICYH